MYIIIVVNELNYLFNYTRQIRWYDIKSISRFFKLSLQD